MKNVAVGIILRDGEVLACQRKQSARYPLKWEFPGGKTEPGETAEAALVRELREELSIHATIDRLFHTQEWTYEEGVSNPEREGSYRVFYFLIRSFAAEMRNHAFEQTRWVSPKELQSMDILEGNKEAVHLLIEYAKKQPEREKS